MANNEISFTKDTGNKMLTVARSLNAPLTQVWDAWSKSEILDKWWAPKPYHIETKSFDFKEGGYWLYKMADEQGGGDWCKEVYHSIQPLKTIVADDMLCDEEGNRRSDLPLMHWHKSLAEDGSNTMVTIKITFDNVEDLEKIMTMGFQEGFTAGLKNLEEVLAERT